MALIIISFFLLDSSECGNEDSDVMPTGHVVGVLQRNWRDYVASFSEFEEVQGQRRSAGKVIILFVIIFVLLCR